MKQKQGAEARSARRLVVDPIEITGFTSLDHMTLISRSGHIINASATGFCLELERDDLVPKILRENLSLDLLVGDRVFLYIPQMNLEMSGTIVRTKLMSKKSYQIAIDFSDDAPEYWRECLFDLLPRPGDFD